MDSGWILVLESNQVCGNQLALCVVCEPETQQSLVPWLKQVVEADCGGRELDERDSGCTQLPLLFDGALLSQQSPLSSR